jgi:Uma2 family endonuclease
MATQTLVTGAQFDLLAEEERQNYELVDGELIEVPSARPSHNLLAAELTTDLRSFLRKRQAGIVLPDTEFDFGAEQRYRPDLAIFLTETWKKVDPEKLPVTLPPEIAVEIISPGDAAHKLERKFSIYLEHGVKEVWVIYPETRHIWVHTRGNAHCFDQSKTLASPIIPGWEIAVRDIFARPV